MTGIGYILEVFGTQFRKLSGMTSIVFLPWLGSMSRFGNVGNDNLTMWSQALCSFPYYVDMLELKFYALIPP